MTKKPTLGRKAPSEPIAAVSAPDTGKVVLWNDPAPVPAPGLSAAFRAALGGTGQPNHLAGGKGGAMVPAAALAKDPRAHMGSRPAASGPVRTGPRMGHK